MKRVIRHFSILIAVLTVAVLPIVSQEAEHQSSADDVRSREVRVGVMLPLHDVNGDGRRMVEYYRGILMACDSLRKQGISVDIHAWNMAEEADVQAILKDPAAANRDVIFGPLYSTQVHPLAEFAEANDIQLVIPFSIDAPDLYTNRHIFQVYQHPNDQTTSNVRRFTEWFKDCHPVIIDCGDSTTTKGPFTFALRREMELNKMKYNLTSLKTSDKDFAKAFVKKVPNVVVLNTSRSPEMLSAFGKLSTLMATNPDIQIAMFGYTEWLMYSKYQTENFCRYNVHIPTPFYTNLQSPVTRRLEQKFRWNFHQDMIQALPRFALTGFDHAVFFIKGLHKYGKTFDGAAGRFGYPAVQTPLKFERIGNGGLRNRAYMFIHFKPDHSIDAVNY